MQVALRSEDITTIVGEHGGKPSIGLHQPASKPHIADPEVARIQTLIADRLRHEVVRSETLYMTVGKRHLLLVLELDPSLSQSEINALAFRTLPVLLQSEKYYDTVAVPPKGIKRVIERLAISLLEKKTRRQPRPALGT